MIDIHTHILPGVDDGSPDLTDSLLMADLAAEGGTSVVIATPHSHVHREDPGGHLLRIRESFQRLSEAVSERNIPVELLLGMEIFCAGDLLEGLENGWFIPMCGTDRYLIEFRFGAPRSECRAHIDTVLEFGGIPVIAHPERYECIQKDPEEAKRWMRRGCRLQINKGSVFGSFGRASRRTALLLLDNRLVTYVGSDAHSPYRRTTYMGDIRDFLSEEYSPGTAAELLQNRAAQDFLN